MRQIDDLPEIIELERQLDNALGEIMDVERCIKGCRSAINDGNSFKLMQELADAQKYVRAAMHSAIAAQDEQMKPVIREAQRLP